MFYLAVEFVRADQDKVYTQQMLKSTAKSRFAHLIPQTCQNRASFLTEALASPNNTNSSKDKTNTNIPHDHEEKIMQWQSADNGNAAKRRPKASIMAGIGLLALLISQPAMSAFEIGKTNSGASKAPVPEVKKESEENLTLGGLKYSLTVKTQPDYAHVRILNIDTAYKAGIRLAPGNYHIEVSAKGYDTKTEWVTLGKKDLFRRIALYDESKFMGDHHALLIGIGDYPSQLIEGPPYDVAAIKESLLNKGFNQKNITVLLDEFATKQAILDQLNGLMFKTKPGDFVFVYFSGQGTSSLDTDIRAPIATSSGALIPYDVAGVRTRAELMERLVLGRTVEPIVRELDESGRRVMFVVDAQYSGNFLGAADTFNYKNVVYLSAAAEHERAQDIPARLIEDESYSTIDNKPHGAFTDTFLRVINGVVNCDYDADTSVSYADLHGCLHKTMRERGFSHTPQLHPVIDADDFLIRQRPIFAPTIINFFVP